MPANLENSTVATGLEKVSLPSNPKERQCQRMFRLPHYCTHLTHASKVILKILQARLQQYMNCELPYVLSGFRKGRGTRNQTANIHCIFEKPREFHKIIYFCFIDYAKAFDSVDHNKSLKILKDMGIPNYFTVALISQASKVMLKILQTRLQQYMNCELPDVQAGFRKGRGSRGQIATIC